MPQRRVAQHPGAASGIGDPIGQIRLTETDALKTQWRGDLVPQRDQPP